MRTIEIPSRNLETRQEVTITAQECESLKDVLSFGEEYVLNVMNVHLRGIARMAHFKTQRRND